MLTDCPLVASRPFALEMLEPRVMLSAAPSGLDAEGARPLASIVKQKPRAKRAAVPKLQIANAAIVEGVHGDASVMTFNVTRTGGKNALNRVTKVSFATAEDGSPNAATQDVDFNAASGTLRFRPLQKKQAVRVVVNNDADEEGHETFVVNLSNAKGGTIVTAQATGTIVDDDAPSLSIDDVSITEGDAGTKTLDFTVTLSAISANVITVDYATFDGSAQDENGDGDYDADAGTVTFNPGDTTQTISITINGDALGEDDETFTVRLSNPIGASISDATGVGTILDDDRPDLSIDDQTIIEGDSGVDTMTFTVTLSAVSAQTVTVKYATVNGTAIAGKDYVAASGTLTFAPGDTSKTIDVLVPGDTRVESHKTFTIALSAPTNATISDANGLGTILENEPIPTVSVGDATVNEGEADKTVNVTFTLSSASDDTVVVRYATIDGTALAGSDYVAAGGNVVFSPGQTSKTVAITIKGDAIAEPTETFSVGVTDVVGAAVADGLGVVTILDNDANPTLSIGNASVTEGGDLVFTITLSQASGNSISVDYATADGTATTIDGDYGDDNGTLVFDPGQTSKTITIATGDDANFEPDETMTVVLSNPSNATIANATGTGTIVNDDALPLISIDDVALAEGDAGTTTFTFTVTLTGDIGSDVVVNYLAASGTATIGSDFEPASGSVTFSPGDTTKTFDVLVNGDADVEADETFLVSLTMAQVGTGILVDGVGVGTIENDD